MERKKVLILITKSNWGGAQRHVYDLATNLNKDNYEVKVMAGGNGPLIEKLQKENIDADGNLPIGRDVKFFEDIKAFFKLCKMLHTIRPQILHVHSSKIGGLGALAGRIMRIPNIIFTAHGWAFNEDRSITSKLILRLSYWVIMILSHRIICASEAVCKQVVNWPLISTKLNTVRNAVTQTSQYSQTNARHTLMNTYPKIKNVLEASKHKSEFWVGTIAELHPIKGYAYALTAIRETVDWMNTTHPQKKLVYIICGEGEDRPNIQSKIDELNLGQNVIMLGHVDNASQYIQAFDVFLLPSLSEALGYVLLEAGLGHTAVVATAVGGIPEVIEDMNSGILVQSRKPREIAHALSFMLDHPKERKMYGNNLKEKVLKDFELKKMVSDIETIYSQNN